MATKQLYDLGDMPPLGGSSRKDACFFSSTGPVWRAK